MLWKHAEKAYGWTGCFLIWLLACSVASLSPGECIGKVTWTLNPPCDLLRLLQMAIPEACCELPTAMLKGMHLAGHASQ